MTRTARQRERDAGLQGLLIGLCAGFVAGIIVTLLWAFGG